MTQKLTTILLKIIIVMILKTIVINMQVSCYDFIIDAKANNVDHKIKFMKSDLFSAINAIESNTLPMLSAKEPYSSEQFSAVLDNILSYFFRKSREFCLIFLTPLKTA